MPGMAFLGVIIYALTEYSSTNFSKFYLAYGWLVPFTLLMVSYMLGHLIQAVSNLVEVVTLRGRVLRYPSDELLSRENKYYGDDLKYSIREAAIDYFSLSKDAPVSDIFRLSYSLLLQKGMGNRAETMNGMYGFYRGMTMASFLGFLIFGVLTLIGAHRVANAQTTAFFLLASILFCNRFRRFGKRFADCVYRDFYVFYCSQGRAEPTEK